MLPPPYQHAEKLLHDIHSCTHSVQRNREWEVKEAATDSSFLQGCRRAAKNAHLIKSTWKAFDAQRAEIDLFESLPLVPGESVELFPGAWPTGRFITEYSSDQVLNKNLVLGTLVIASEGELRLSSTLEYARTLVTIGRQWQQGNPAL